LLEWLMNKRDKLKLPVVRHGDCSTLRRPEDGAVYKNASETTSSRIGSCVTSNSQAQIKHSRTLRCTSGFCFGSWSCENGHQPPPTFQTGMERFVSIPDVGEANCARRDAVDVHEDRVVGQLDFARLPLRVIAAVADEHLARHGPPSVRQSASSFSPERLGPEDFHLRALREPYVNLSIHTAPVVRPLP
jgi:hypothetical protein